MSKSFLKKKKTREISIDCFSDPHRFELPWSVEMLKEMLMTKFPQLQNMPLPFLHQGMNPSTAIKKAHF
jgi:hypothetical protein